MKPAAALRGNRAYTVAAAFLGDSIRTMALCPWSWGIYPGGSSSDCKVSTSGGTKLGLAGCSRTSKTSKCSTSRMVTYRSSESIKKDSASCLIVKGRKTSRIVDGSAAKSDAWACFRYLTALLATTGSSGLMSPQRNVSVLKRKETCQGMVETFALPIS